MAVFPFDSIDDAVDQANATPYGLNASIWTGNPSRGAELSKRFEAGTVNVNEAYAAAWASIDAPMGGYKDSGIGRRHGAAGILRYAETQTVAVQRLMPLAAPEGVAEETYSRIMTDALTGSQKDSGSAIGGEDSDGDHLFHWLSRVSRIRAAAKSGPALRGRHSRVSCARKVLADGRAPRRRLDSKVSCSSKTESGSWLGISRNPISVSGVRQEIASDVREIYHLAAIYDLSVPRSIGMKVNVDGTRNMLDFADSCTQLNRFQYVSTCYVSGAWPGIFGERDLEKGQQFNNFYEETKYLAEVEVQKRMHHGLPVTIYRPAIVVGDSDSGETQKYDGPYYVIRWLLRQPFVAILPIVGNPNVVRVNVVPRDFVIRAIGYLSGLESSAGKVYQLADPNPLTVSELIDVIGKATGRLVVRVPAIKFFAKAAIDYVPGVFQVMQIPICGDRLLHAADLLLGRADPSRSRRQRYRYSGPTRLHQQFGPICLQTSGNQLRCHDLSSVT